MSQRPTTAAITDSNHGDVRVEVELDGDDGGGSGGPGGSGGDSAGHDRTRLVALRDSVVARLLIDSRPPRGHTPAAVSCSTTNVRGALRSLPPPVDLSAAKLVCRCSVDEFRGSYFNPKAMSATNIFYANSRSSLTTALGIFSLLFSQLAPPPRF